MNHGSKRTLLASLIGFFGLLALVGWQAGVGEALAQAATSINIDLTGNTQPRDLEFSQFWKAWTLLDQNFVQTHSSTTIPTYQERVYGAIAGLTDSFGDPYTVFFPPAEAQAFQEDIQGEFGGVGMELGTKDKKLIVVSPLKDSPAEKAGMRSGDTILEIDGKASVEMPVEEAVKLIRGIKGTSVVLTVGREGEAQPLTVSIVRDTIQIPIIKNYLRQDGIYVIEMYSFSANSAELFRLALRDFVTSGSTKLVLDLRGNPGGYLEAAVHMASFFLPTGDVIVSEDFNGKQDNISHRSLGYNVFAGKKLSMAILVDQGSASASEILAGALQQHQVAQLVGTRTFGKGSVQQLFPLGNGAEIKITIARWLTPNGDSISDGGLTPNIQAERTIEDYKANKDPQMDAAVTFLLAH